MVSLPKGGHASDLFSFSVLKVKDLQALIDKVTAKHSQMVSWSKKTVHILEGKLKSLTEEREAVHTELNW